MIKSIIAVGIAITLCLTCGIQKAGQNGKNSENVKHLKTSDESYVNRNPVEIRCQNQNCSTFVYLKNGKETFVADFPKEPSTNILSGNLVRISYSCGSPCNYTTFVNLKSGQISKPFFLVMAIDTLKENVVFCDSACLLLSHIFDTSAAPIKIERPFSLSASPFTVVDSAFFRSNHFIFRFLTGKEYKDVWDSIEVK